MSEHFSRGDRWLRAKQDTSGFEKWPRNLILSFLAALITFLAQWWVFRDWGEAKQELWLSLLVLGVAFLVLPLIEFLWHYSKAPRRLLEDKFSAMRTELAGLQQKLREREESVTREEWKELSDRFARGTPDTFADWQRHSDGSESWEVRSPWPTKDSESVCRLAGAMLARSPNLFSGLSEKVRLQSDPLTRWLDFLVESGVGTLEGFMHARETDTEGKPVGMLILVASLNHLDAASARACIECAARETLNP